MRKLFELQSPDLYNEASTSKKSMDQEMESSEMSNDGNVAKRNSTFRCFFFKIDLNCTRMVLAEMVGTFILMFCVCGIISITQLMGGAVGLLEYAATAGLTIVVVIFSIGDISGAHINPSITLAFAVFGHFSWPKVPFYISAQVTGSLLATYIGKLIYGVKTDLMTTRPLHGCVSAFWLEFIATFMVMFLAAALTSEAQSVGRLSGLVFGIVIGLAVLVTGPISGGSMNPARSLGPAIIAWKFDYIWIYLIAPTVGAIAGALLFWLLHLQPRRHSSAATPSTSIKSILSHPLH